MTHSLHHKPFILTDFSDKPVVRPKPEEPVQQEAQPPVAPQEKPKPKAPVKPTFSEEELLAAQKEAEELGRMKGEMAAKREWDQEVLKREEAVRESNDRVAEVLSGLMTRIDEELAAQEKARVRQRGDLSGIVMMIARKLSGAALDSQPLGAVEGMVNDCMVMLAGEARLAIRVHEALAEPLKAHLEKMPREGQEVEVLVDAQMQPGDCQIQWPGGKAERDQEELWKEMEGIVQRALSPPDKD